MVGLFKKILPGKPASNNTDDDDDGDDDYESSVDNMEYSLALEYNGPLLTFDIPHIAPVNIDTIPVAAAVVSTSLSDDTAVPVVPPIIPSKKKIYRVKVCDSDDAEGQVVENFMYGDAVVCTNELRKGCGLFDGALGKINGDESVNNSPGTIRRSALLRSSNSLDELHRVSGNLNSLGSNEGGLSSGLDSHDASSSEPFSSKEEFCGSGTSEEIGRPHTVTFHEYVLNGDIIEPVLDPQSSSETDAVFSDAQPQSIHVRPMAIRNGKKGSCYRCFKGNRFTEKEVCLVCGAKYCSNCVRRAMGSMTEGRKCITCTGYRVDESRRRTLGRCSRMLKKILTEFEIKQIMDSEIHCEANQLPAELVYVNKEPLCQEELHLLQSARHPPKHLEPGYYWYDKVSGFWGKEGQKPCQIITPQLDIGGHIESNASNGNTNVLINNREITKAELRMLQVAGVRCEKGTHFWVSADGSYQEEGMNNVKGKIWDKRKIRLYCAVTSSPIPPDSVSGQDVNSHGTCCTGIAVEKLLLVGYHKSGTSTIFKQAKLLNNIPFSKDERQEMRILIKSNLYGYLGILLEAREIFEEESLTKKRKTQSADEPSSSVQVADKTIYTLGPRLKEFSDWFLNVMVSGKLEVISLATTRENAELVEGLWKDPAIQATYNRISELPTLPRAANYLLDKAIEISRTDYEPSDMDILYSEGIKLSNGLACAEFYCPKSDGKNYMDSDSHYDSPPSYQLIKLHLKHLGTNRKCLEMFEDINIVIFCVSLSDYDEYYEDIHGIMRNKMLESKQLFESIVTHPRLDKKNFLLVLNKYDLLEEKIEQIPLTQCEWFSDFNPVISHNYNRGRRGYNMAPLAQRAFQYVATKFKRLFSSLTGDRKLYVSMVTALESDTVDDAIRYAREIIKWGDWEPTVIITDEISCTNEESS